VIELSLLICSTHTRYKTFAPRIQDQINSQINALDPRLHDTVEYLILTDNRQRCVGLKRNNLLDLAQGRYLCFIDDDDRLADDYLSSILTAITERPDVVTFLADVSMSGGPPVECRYSLEYTANQNSRTYKRMPNHLCPVKTDLARRVKFPQTNWGEDDGYAYDLRPHLRTEIHIPRTLYFYDYDDATTETQQNSPATQSRLAKRNPIADVVILSNATTPALATMTQTAVTTALHGAHAHINIMVLEQTGHAYQGARTIHTTGPFAYNKFCNAGAGEGQAPWIMFANNDLEFGDDWLHPLLNAGNPVVSPINPGDPRQAHISQNTAGYSNGTHLSGWCFMMRRDIWYAIGGLDEDFILWCADDATIEQLKPLGVAPMLVPASRVTHKTSVTLHSQDDARQDELTWAMVDLFNHKYGANKFAGDGRYQAWKQRNSGLTISTRT
jgi:hypothetical protein